MDALGRRRHDKIRNLAAEFGISERTVRRDIEILSLTEPIRTETGRYCGGVYVLDSYYKRKKYLSESQISALRRVLDQTYRRGSVVLSECEISSIREILSDFTKPVNGRGEG